MKRIFNNFRQPGAFPGFCRPVWSRKRIEFSVITTGNGLPRPQTVTSEKNRSTTLNWVTWAFLLVWPLFCCGQTSQDSTLLNGMGWTVSSPQPGLTVKQIEIPIFNSEQSISLIEIDTAYYALHFTQRKDRETVQRLARKASADAAVNGGFFVTKTERALANDYLEIDGKLAAHKKDWGFGSAAVAVVDGTNLEFTLWNKEMGTNDTDWVSQYENVMAAGPLLLLDGECKVAHNTNQDRHPRTVIGCKPDGKLILLVVDGRQEGADGMTLAELGYTCYALGMSDAMNLDGGGSSSLWVKGERYVNQPSDKVLFFRVKRPVANAVVVKPKPGR